MRKKKAWSSRDFEYLESTPGYGGLITFYEDDNENANYPRKLCFLDMSSTIAKHYYMLSESNQYLIGRLVSTLTKKEHQGFNLQMYLYWLTKAQQDDVGLLQIHIAEYLAEIGEKSIAVQGDGEITDPKDINSQIAKLKSRKSIGEDTPMYKQLKENLLFSTELLKNGNGFIEIVKPEVIEEYYKHPEYYIKHRKTVVDRNKQIVMHLKETTIKQELEDYGKYRQSEWHNMVDKIYCYFNYTMAYALLDESSRQLVDEFIEVLYKDNKGAEMLVGLYQNILDGTIEPDKEETITRDISDPLDENE